MRISTRLWFVAVYLLLNLSACFDHQLGGPFSPARLRLKTVQGAAINTTYTYDSQNRLATIAKADGSLGVFAYGDPDKHYVYTDTEKDFTYFILYPNPADKTTGEITRLPLTLSGTTFQADTYPLINSKLYQPTKLRYTTYSFDVSKRISSVYRYLSGPVGDNFAYAYPAENSIHEVLNYSGGHFTVSYKLDFDSKINPFYGLFDPDLDALEVFSRNNLVTTTLTSDPTPKVVTVYDYEYNAQGLPTKRTTKQGTNPDETLTFTYESY